MMPFILFDTETTGLVQAMGTDLKHQPQIIEFAAIKLNNDLDELGRIEFLCSPGIPLPPVITKITGITNDKIKDEPPFSHYLPALKRFFLGSATLVAHNLMFDQNLLMFELQRLNAMCQFPWPPTGICTVEASMHIKNRRMKLEELYEHYTGTKPILKHRAMGDVETLVACFKGLREDGVV